MPKKKASHNPAVATVSVEELNITAENSVESIMADARSFDGNMTLEHIEKIKHAIRSKQFSQEQKNEIVEYFFTGNHKYAVLSLGNFEEVLAELISFCYEHNSVANNDTLTTLHALQFEFSQQSTLESDTDAESVSTTRSFSRYIRSPRLRKPLTSDEHFTDTESTDAESDANSDASAADEHFTDTESTDAESDANSDASAAEEHLVLTRSKGKKQKVATPTLTFDALCTKIQAAKTRLPNNNTGIEKEYNQIRTLLLTAHSSYVEDENYLQAADHYHEVYERALALQKHKKYKDYTSKPLIKKDIAAMVAIGRSCLAYTLYTLFVEDHFGTEQLQWVLQIATHAKAELQKVSKIYTQSLQVKEDKYTLANYITDNKEIIDLINEALHQDAIQISMPTEETYETALKQLVESIDSLFERIDNTSSALEASSLNHIVDSVKAIFQLQRPRIKTLLENVTPDSLEQAVGIYAELYMNLSSLQRLFSELSTNKKAVPERIYTGWATSQDINSIIKTELPTDVAHQESLIQLFQNFDWVRKKLNTLDQFFANAFEPAIRTILAQTEGIAKTAKIMQLEPRDEHKGIAKTEKIIHPEPTSSDLLLTTENAYNRHPAVILTLDIYIKLQNSGHLSDTQMKRGTALFIHALAGELATIEKHKKAPLEALKTVHSLESFFSKYKSLDPKGEAREHHKALFQKVLRKFQVPKIPFTDEGYELANSYATLFDGIKRLTSTSVRSNPTWLLAHFKRLTNWCNHFFSAKLSIAYNLKSSSNPLAAITELETLESRYTSCFLPFDTTAPSLSDCIKLLRENLQDIIAVAPLLARAQTKHPTHGPESHSSASNDDDQSDGSTASATIPSKQSKKPSVAKRDGDPVARHNTKRRKTLRAATTQPVVVPNFMRQIERQRQRKVKGGFTTDTTRMQWRGLTPAPYYTQLKNHRRLALFQPRNENRRHKNRADNPPQPSAT